MTTYNFEVSRELPGDPATIYRAWRSSEGHSAMTGAVASVDPSIDGAFSAWHGYIEGRTLVTITHSGVPVEQTGYEHGGWDDSYLEPMSEYFAQAGDSAQALI